MITYSWILKYSWAVGNGSRIVLSNTPGNAHLIDVTLPYNTDHLIQSVIAKKWTVYELTRYLNTSIKIRAVKGTGPLTQILES